MAIVSPKFDLDVYLQRDIVCQDTVHASQAFATALGQELGIVDSEIQLVDLLAQGEAACQKLDPSTLNLLRQRVVFETRCLGLNLPPSGLRNLVPALQKTHFSCLEDLAGTFSTFADVSTLVWE
jgi:hypothetical protein